MNKVKIFVPNYIDSLLGTDLDRYKSKIELCNGLDPYEIDLKEVSRDVDKWPNVLHEDIVQYLLFTTNSVTMEQMKAYKGLEGHNFFISGWVQELLLKVLENKLIIVLGKVKHSYSLNDSDLSCWIALEQDGCILTAHCTCMAGRGEACSHVGAILFTLKHINMKQKSVTCTSKINAWLPPSLKEVKCSEIRQEDFTSSKRKYSKLCLHPSSDAKVELETMKKCKTYAATTDKERVKFLKDAEKKGINCVIMAYVKETNEKYSTEKQEPKTGVLPKPLSSLYSKEFINIGLEDLKKESIIAFQTLKVSESDTYKIERLTVKQSNSDMWYEQRAGRITASNMKSVIHTDLKNPSLSLIKKICYPKATTFFSDYTEHGKKNEKNARNDYIKKMKKEHQQFFFQEAGFLIDHVHPFIGASPDGLVTCICHGLGLLEIKCPTSEDIENSSGLQQGSLARDHMYFYQVQTQLLVWKLDYSDFVVWKSAKDFVVKRIYGDKDFQQKIIDGATTFFKEVLLPELLAKYFSSLKHTPLGELNFEPKLICVCQRPACHPVIKCQNEQCVVKYFHWKCVGVKGNRKIWFCQQCEKEKKTLKAKN